MRASNFSTGADSMMSSDLPCGTPGTMSIRATSASSFSTIRWAAVAPTFPAPTTVTFCFMFPSLRPLSRERERKARGFYRARPGPQPRGRERLQ